MMAFVCSAANRVHDEWVFFVLLATFVVGFVAQYPATYAIDYECNILSLAFSIAHGTVFLDQAGIDLDADRVWLGSVSTPMVFLTIHDSDEAAIMDLARQSLDRHAG